MTQPSHEILRAAFDASPLPMAVAVERCFIAVNPAMTRLFGYTSEQMLGASARILYPSDEAFERIGRAHLAACTASKAVGIETEFVTSDGRCFPGRFYSHAVDPADLSKGVVGVIEDLSERRRIQSDLHERKALIEAMTQHLPAGAFVKDARSWQYLLWNPRCETLYGVARDQAIGKTDFELFDREFAQALRHSDEEALARPGVLDIPARRITALTGRESVIHTRKVAVMDAAGEPRWVVGMSQDVTEALRAEAELRRSEATYRAIVESALDAIVINDAQGRITEFNPAAERIFGWSREQVIGREVAEVLIPERFRHIQKNDLVNAIPQFQGNRAETIALHADGHEFPVEMTVQRMDTGEQVIFVAFMRDLTAQKQAEQQRAQLAAILDATPDFVAYADAGDTHIIYMNPAGRKMIGVGLDEDVSRLKIADTHPEWMSKLLRDQAIPAAVRDGVWTGEAAFLNREGREMPVAMVLLAHKSPSGEVAILSTISRDISERKRAEALLEDAQRRTRNILDSIGEGVLGLDMRGSIVFENPAALAMLGWTHHELIGQPSHALMHHTRADGSPYLQDDCRVCLTFHDGVARHVEDEVFWRKDGSSFPVAYTSTVMRNDAGQTTGTVLAFSDITERKRAQCEMQQLMEQLTLANRALEQASRVKSDFMNSVTHELRTPLNAVIGFAALLKDEVSGPLNAQQMEFATDILSSGERLLALVEGILEMSQLDVGGGALVCEPVEIGAALEQRIAAQRAAAEARGVTVQLDVTADVGSVELDPKALRYMFDALLGNAIKFNREGGTVAVSARRAGGWIEVAVTDAGIGIAREDLAKLFRPFVQLDAGLARRHGGIGLGLALARRQAELHGGTIAVESEAGEGSRFTLRLPVKEMV